jgi:hypothetical protein
LAVQVILQILVRADFTDELCGAGGPVRTRSTFRYTPFIELDPDALRLNATELAVFEGTSTTHRYGDLHGPFSTQVLSDHLSVLPQPHEFGNVLVTFNLASAGEEA